MNNMSEIIQVGQAYSHYDKMVRCRGVIDHDVIDPTISRLKWYDINRSDQPIEQSIFNLAQKFISSKLRSDDSPSAKELGFVLLHRCGEEFYFLGLCTWRGNNELWKTIFFLETDTMEEFALFAQDGPHKDTFCVWELAVVCHEMQAWTTYLKSNRTDQDADRYLTAVI